MDYTAKATRGGTEYSDSTTVAFHVGPISELEVRDGGEGSPLAPAGRTAYTIVAANNGPDTAPAVAVTLSGVPEGSRAFVSPGDGHYAKGDCSNGLCAGTWTLGHTPHWDTRANGGKLAFPTLTVIPPPGAEAPSAITASIRNTQPYTVVIDGTTHSTDYFDHIPENSSDVTIAARPGTGEGAPGQPQSLRAQLYPDTREVLLRWDEVELLHGYTVTHYEVHESSPDPTCRRPRHDAPASEITKSRDGLYLDEMLEQAQCYAVRAVNAVGEKGYWSQSVGTLRGVQLSAAALTVSEAPGAANEADYTVVLSSRPSDGDVTVDIATDNPGAVELSETRLTFSDEDWHVPQTVTVSGVNDQKNNPSNRRTATVRHTASGGGFTGAAPATLVVTVTDDDGPRGVTLSAQQVTVAEDSGEGRYTFSLNSAPDPGRGPVVVELSVSGGAATVTPTRLTFTAADWSEPRALTVLGVDDDEDNEHDRRTVTISHAIAGGGYGNVSVPDVTVTVVDDDGPSGAGEPGVTLSQTSITVPENGAQSYSVVLNSAPTGDGAVRVDLTVADPALVTLDADHLSFTSSDWDQPQLVLVSGVDDNVRNPAERRTKIHHVVGGGGYEGVAIDPVEVAVTDDEASGVTVSVGELQLQERGNRGDAGETRHYTVRLNTRPAHAVTVRVRSDDTSVATVSPGTLRFTREDWYVPHVVTVTGVNDDRNNQNDERITAIRHTVESADPDYGSLAAQAVRVVVADDDEVGAWVADCFGGTALDQDGFVRDDCEHQSPPVRDGGTITVTAGQWWDFCMALDSRPGRELSVRVTSSDHAVARPIGGYSILGFTPQDWERCRDVPETNTNGALDIPANQQPGAEARITLSVSSSEEDGTGLNYPAGMRLITFTLCVERCEADGGSLGGERTSADPLGQAPAVDPALVAAVQGYAAETESGAEHVERWTRVLAAFGVAQHASPMTVAEARTHAATYWSVRWDPVVAALEAIEAAQTP
ncbi:MAG: hypothetical protein OXG95_09925 [Chloroflexi bacterium]|nr:hypothetical protein [Chloroflexota bacterium]